MEKNFYDILGCHKNDSQEDIKKSYRKLALKFHPDKGGNPDTFKSISEAFSTLGDETKRKEYDNTNNSYDINFDSFFKSDIFEKFNAAQRNSSTRTITLNVSLEDLFTGKHAEFKFERHVCCLGCNGIGGNGSYLRCSSCNGVGKIRRVLELGVFHQQTIGTCPDCDGLGKTMQYVCNICNGEGTIEEIDTLSIHIHKGTQDGETISLREQGDFNPSAGIHNDLLLIIKAKLHSRLKVKKYDLILEQVVSLYDALTGGNIQFIHLNGQKYILRTSKCIRPNDTLMIKGFGMPHRNKPSKCGNLFIHFNIQFPESLIDNSAALASLLRHNIKQKQGEYLEMVEFTKPENEQSCSQQ